MWQHSVIGDYLAKYRVSFTRQCLEILMVSLRGNHYWSCDLQSDRRKAQAGMEAAWKSMEKKEKIPWIKKAAEDQKRYEVWDRPVVCVPRPLIDPALILKTFPHFLY